jgi:hypothetical protein
MLKQVWLVLMPSWLSGLFAALVSLVMVVGTAIITNYQGSSLQQQLFEVKSSGGVVSGFDYQNITANLSRNQVIGNLPLFLFWAALGVVVYLLATSLWAGLSNAEELREELDYVNAPKRWIVRTVLVHLLVRLVVVLVWVAYLQLSLRVLLPYVLAVAHIAATNLASINGIAYLLLGLAVAFVAVQAHTVFLRLLLLKVRVFGSAV